MNYKYKIELNYGYEETESGVFHAFLATDPKLPPNCEEMGTRLAEMMDTTLDCGNFNWNSMYIALPDSLIRRIKRDGVEEYLEKFND